MAVESEKIGLDGTADMEADATGLIADVGDFTIKQLIEGGVLNDAPVLGWFAKAARTGIALRDYFLIQKIGTFLSAAGASPPDRDEFRLKLQTDDRFKSEMARLLVLTLDRLDELEKARLLGRIFTALVYDEITRDEMRRFCSALERVYLPDLQALRDFVRAPDEAQLGAAAFLGLESAGLVAAWHSIVRPARDDEKKGVSGRQPILATALAERLVSVVFPE